MAQGYTPYPADPPVPQHGGAADHLPGLALPALPLPATDGGTVDLAALQGTVRSTAAQSSLSHQHFHQIFWVWPRSWGRMQNRAGREVVFPACKDACMAGSWRHILDSATANPAIDRGGARPGQPQHGAPVPGPRQHAPAQYHSAVQARSALEHELAAFSGRLAEDGPAPARAPARSMDVRPPAPPGVPAGYRPAPPSGQPAGYSPAPRHVQQPGYRPEPHPVQQPEYRPAPPPAQPSGHRPPASGRESAAAQDRAPVSQQEVPYQSLMDALSRATPTMLTEAEKHAPAERLPAIRKAQAASRGKPGWRSRLGWRSTVAISALVLTAGVSGYALLGHGGLSRLGKIAGMSQTGQTPSAIFSNGAWVNVPLPRRRPAALRAEQAAGHGEPASAAN